VEYSAYSLNADPVKIWTYAFLEKK
jgi:hypothetical protein